MIKSSRMEIHFTELETQILSQAPQFVVVDPRNKVEVSPKVLLLPMEGDINQNYVNLDPMKFTNTHDRILEYFDNHVLPDLILNSEVVLAFNRANISVFNWLNFGEEINKTRVQQYHTVEMDSHYGMTFKLEGEILTKDVPGGDQLIGPFLGCSDNIFYSPCIESLLIHFSINDIIKYAQQKQNERSFSREASS